MVRHVVRKVILPVHESYLSQWLSWDSPVKAYEELKGIETESQADQETPLPGIQPVDEPAPISLDTLRRFLGALPDLMSLICGPHHIERLAPQYFETGPAESMWHYHVVSLAAQQNPVAHLAYLHRIYLMCTLRYVSSRICALVNPYFLKCLWFTHLIQIRDFLDAWGKDWKACHWTNFLRVDMRMYYPHIMDRERTSLEEWPGVHDSRFQEYFFRPPAHQSPIRLEVETPLQVDRLYRQLFVVLTNITYFDTGYTGQGVVSSSPPPEQFLLGITRIRPLGTLTTLRISLPTNGTELHDHIEYLVGLKELCCDFVTDYPPRPAPHFSKPVRLPNLLWLAVGGCPTVSALQIIKEWDLPILEQLICKTGYEPEPYLLPTFQHLGKNLRHLALLGDFIADEPMDFRQHCTVLTSIEVTTNHSGIVIAPHPCIITIRFDDLSKCSLPGWDTIPHFTAQLDNILRYRTMWSSLRYFHDPSWHQAILNEDLITQEAAPWWKLEDLSALYEAAVTVIDTNYKPLYQFNN
ncbi:hypothetical protein M422DRAFT_47751 [Sphaerobolus stellatus SS14]|uniref:Uncharacterized protein n=1 Tax=Sphaerobolus stellatus (strain SS14) TaxID=990650 RepID=A0A0C9VYS0_SPHS4|nr:hypothetical protein M422DRAFT_47751 [Sphaerobolus stellatus SS14]